MARFSQVQALFALAKLTLPEQLSATDDDRGTRSEAFAGNSDAREIL